MSTGDVFVRITNEYYQLTGSEKKIGDYVLSHQRETPYLSISELAEECGVAEATVSRFCRRLDFKGYNAFKVALANASADPNPHSPLVGAVQSDDTILNMCKKVYTAEVDAIRQTLNLIRPEYILTAADILRHAEHVLCIGQGGSMILAHEATHLFSSALPGFSCVWDTHLQAIALSQLSARDAVLVFSYTGFTKDLIGLLKIVKKQGAKSILITHFPKSPGAADADVVLQCGSRESPVQLGSVTARMSQLFIADILFSEVCRHDMPRCEKKRNEIAEVLAGEHFKY